MRRRSFLRTGSLVLPALLAGPSPAHTESYSDETLEDAELVVVVDVSGSIGPEEMDLQFRG